MIFHQEGGHSVCTACSAHIEAMSDLTQVAGRCLNLAFCYMAFLTERWWSMSNVIYICRSRTRCAVTCSQHRQPRQGPSPRQPKLATSAMPGQHARADVFLKTNLCLVLVMIALLCDTCTQSACCQDHQRQFKNSQHNSLVPWQHVLCLADKPHMLSLQTAYTVLHSSMVCSGFACALVFVMSVRHKMWMHYASS